MCWKYLFYLEFYHKYSLIHVHELACLVYISCLVPCWAMHINFIYKSYISSVHFVVHFLACFSFLFWSIFSLYFRNPNTIAPIEMLWKQICFNFETFFSRFCQNFFFFKLKPNKQNKQTGDTFLQKWLFKIIIVHL